MTYTPKYVIFMKKKETQTNIILDLLLPGAAYLEDVLLVESTEFEKKINIKSKFVTNHCGWPEGLDDI